MAMSDSFCRPELHTLAALKSLADEGKIATSVVADAVAKYGIDPNKPNPVTQ